MLELIDSILIPRSRDNVSRLHFMLTSADYLRYGAEATPVGRQQSEAARKSLDVYDNIYFMATVSVGLPANNRIVLQTMFHKSILQHDILGDLDGALHTCAKAMEDANKANTGVFSMIWPSSWSPEARILLHQIQQTYDSWNPLVMRENDEKDCLNDEWVVCAKIGKLL